MSLYPYILILPIALALYFRKKKIFGLTLPQRQLAFGQWRERHLTNFNRAIWLWNAQLLLMSTTVAGLCSKLMVLTWQSWELGGFSSDTQAYTQIGAILLMGLYFPWYARTLRQKPVVGIKQLARKENRSNN